MAISWDDLKIKMSNDEASRWIIIWTDWVNEPVQPLFMSKFGDWFLRQLDGSTKQLSVIAGRYTTIARTPSEFTLRILSPDWAQAYLLSELVLQLHQRGLKPDPGECYGFDPHPFLSGGEINLDHAKIMPIEEWQSICAKMVPAPT